MKKRLKKVFVDGGPHSGKTSAIHGSVKEKIEPLQKRLEGVGWRGFIVPEVATNIITNCSLDMLRLIKEKPEAYLKIEAELLKKQMNDAITCQNIAGILADEHENGVLVFDRGPNTVNGHVGEGEFEPLLKSVGLTYRDVLFDADAVIHMVTTADGAEEHYSYANNPSRYQSPEEARATDRRILNAYIGHPHLYIIDNSTDWPGKYTRFWKAILRTLGIPKPMEIERKFLVAGDDPYDLIPERCSTSLIEQYYLDIPCSEEFRGFRGEARVRREFFNFGDRLRNTQINSLTQKGHELLGTRSEVEIEINYDDVLRLLKFCKKDTGYILKRRHYFVYKHQYFVLDVFSNLPWTSKTLCLLEIELLDPNDKVELPPFLDIVQEVTGNPEYANSEIAKKR